MREVDKLSLEEYIRYVHKLPWEEFVAESVVKSGTYYVQALYDKARETKAETIVELGVMMGQSTRALLKAAIENSGHLYSVEPNRETLLWVRDALRAGGSDTSFLTTFWGNDLDIAKAWAGGRPFLKAIDFLFIDTLHTYEQTLNELESYLPLMDQKGIIVLHDTYMDDKEPDRYPVKRAVDDWIKRHGEWVFEDITPAGDGWGLGLVRRK